MAPDWLTLAVLAFWHSWFIKGIFDLVFMWLLLWFCWSISLFLWLGWYISPFYCFGSVNLFLHLFGSVDMFPFVWVSFVSSCFSNFGCRVATCSNPFTGPLLEDVLALFSNLHPDTGLLQFLSTQTSVKGSALWLPLWSKVQAIKRLKGFVLAWQSSTLSTKTHTTKKTISMSVCLAGSVRHTDLK